MRIRDQVVYGGGLVGGLEKDFSDSAREAAAEARVKGDKPKPLHYDWKSGKYSDLPGEKGSQEQAHALLENHLSGKKGIVITSRGTDAQGQHFVGFHDNLYDAHGTATMTAKPWRGGNMAVEMQHPDGTTVKTGSIDSSRIQMKRVYYGGDPKQSLRNQPGLRYTAGMGRHGRQG